MEKFDFDDILIVPETSTDITSRYKDITLPETLPLFTAPMDTVVDLTNIDEFIDNNIMVVLPRTVRYLNFLEIFVENKKKYKNVFVSFSLNEIEEIINGNLDLIHKNAHILIDIANGHMEKITTVAKKIKEIRPDIIIMVGNIANPETYSWYAIQNCVDYIRVGIGAGGGCLTTKNSGIGYPMASLIHETSKFKKEFEKLTVEIGDNIKAPKIIADGGMKDYVDIIKALNLGADYVMLGSMFNKTFESCPSNYIYGIKVNKKISKYLFNKGFPIKKCFRGMSTKQAQKAMGKTIIKTSEGVVRYRKVEYHLSGWVENFTHYLRNTMSYSNTKLLHQFIGKTNFIRITKNVYDRFNK